MQKKKLFITLLFVIFSFAGAAVFAHSHSLDHHHGCNEHDDRHHEHHHHHGNDHVWEGIDHAVIEKFAEEAGRPPRGSLINPSGELLLSVFLLAGAIGGFTAGYYYRRLFCSGEERG